LGVGSLMIEKLGYEVLQAKNGTEAFQDRWIIQQTDGNFSKHSGIKICQNNIQNAHFTIIITANIYITQKYVQS
jgi:hypothetical protein